MQSVVGIRAGRSAIAAAALALLTAGSPAPEEVRPSAADPAVHAYDLPNLVYGGGPDAKAAPLAVFLPGSGGKSTFAPKLLLETVARQGYRVVFLSYDDEPSVSQVCPRQPPACSALFRRARVFGDIQDGPVRNPRAEAIVPRLAALLRYLDRAHPDAGWSAYLTPDGQPAWPRIVVSGLSQGAGMAAFIAKRFPVHRVVLFSSPWDVTGPDHRPAPWLDERSATPPARWWAERHVRETTTKLIADAYRALAIPPDHILLFDAVSPARGRGPNPFHGTTVRLPVYVPAWRRMYGTPGD